MSGARPSRRTLFRQFSNVPHGIPIVQNGETAYTVEPLHAEVMLAHRLAYQCDNPYCGALHLFDDTFLSEVHAVLCVPPEDAAMSLPDTLLATTNRPPPELAEATADVIPLRIRVRKAA